MPEAGRPHRQLDVGREVGRERGGDCRDLANVIVSDLRKTTLRFDSLAAANPLVGNSLTQQFIMST